MTIASHGYDGTLDEADFARLMELVGRPPVVAGPTDLLVEPVAGARAVTLRPGTAYATGVAVDLDDTDGTPRLSLPTPTDGQFFLIVLRRDWTANNADPDAGDLIDGSSLEVLSGNTTENVAPAAPPTVLPALAAEPGVRSDQPLAWVWATSASTEVTVWDLRTWPEAWERVPNIAARDAIPADRLYVGKRVLVDATGQTWRRGATTWNLEGLTPCTSTTRPAEPYLDMLIFETDTKQFGYWDGGTWVFPSRDASALTSGTVDVSRLPSSVQRAAAEAGVDEERLGRAAKNMDKGDCNAIGTTGFYRGSAMANAPTADWVFLLVIRHDDTYVRQVAFHFFSAKVWIRHKDGGTWSGWTYVPNAGDLNGGYLDGRYYREDEINSFRSNDNIDIGRITHSSYNGGGRNGFWQGYLPDNYYGKSQTNSEIENRINARGFRTMAVAYLSIMSANGSRNSASVTYPSGRFNGSPYPMVTPYSSTPDNCAVSVTNASNSGCTVVLSRKDNAGGPTAVWFAAFEPA